MTTQTKRPRRCRGPSQLRFLFTLWWEGMVGALVGLRWHGVGMGGGGQGQGQKQRAWAPALRGRRRLRSLDSRGGRLHMGIACAGVGGGVGIPFGRLRAGFRLRRSIRFARRSAPLRMTTEVRGQLLRQIQSQVLRQLQRQRAGRPLYAGVAGQPHHRRSTPPRCGRLLRGTIRRLVWGCAAGF
jgi:hypothetical protein